MSIWSRLFWRWSNLVGRASAKRSGPIDDPTPSVDVIAKRALLFTEGKRTAVQNAMGRLGAAGLRVNPSIHSELAGIRCLYDFEQMFSVDELTGLFSPRAGAKPFVSLDLWVFWRLSSETDSLSDVQDIEVLIPRLSALSDHELDGLCEIHSMPMFENAAEVSIVNDGFLADEQRSEFLQHLIGELFALACGDLEIRSFVSSGKSGRLFGQIILSGGQSAFFEIIDEKRPDITPLFRAMNELAENLEVGRFLASVTGSSESLVALYLRPDEQVRFRAWEKDQYSGGGAFIGAADWIQ